MLKELNHFIKSLLCLAILLASGSNAQDWHNANISNFSFPKNFLLGAMDTNHLAAPPLGNRLTTASNDLALIKPLGLNSHAFTIRWDLVEPKQGIFDEKIMNHYAEKIKELRAAGVEPIVILHYYKSPAWFMDLGGFEKEENSHYFIQFAKRTITAIGIENLSHIVTLYQPAGYALEGYFRGTNAPNKKNMQKALEVMQHMLSSHVALYKIFKAFPNGHKTKIGLVHQLYELAPYRTWNPLDQLAAKVANAINNDLLLEFFKSGNFSFTMPFVLNSFPFTAHIDHTDGSAPHAIDFMGISYLSQAQMNFMKVIAAPGIPTDIDIFSIQPEGLYAAIKKASQLAKPIYIIGNGIADAADRNRELFLKRHLYMTSKAIADGYNVQAYFYRSLTDYAPNQKFGLYAIDFDTLKECIRPSAACLARIMSAHAKRHGKTIE